jgi:hypothetical protein
MIAINLLNGNFDKIDAALADAVGGPSFGKLFRTTTASAPSGGASNVMDFTTSDGNSVPAGFLDLANDQLKVPVDGVYVFIAQAVWSANTTGHRKVRLQLNGTDLKEHSVFPDTSVQFGMQVSTVGWFSKNDTIRGAVSQSSGGALNYAQASSGVNDINTAFLAGARLR